MDEMDLKEVARLLQGDDDPPYVSLPLADSPAAVSAQEGLTELPIALLQDFPKSRFNRYRIHEGEKMEALVDSIRRNGILQPIVVRPLTGGQYQVVDGRNRREAARTLGYDTIPCIVRKLNDTEALWQLNFLNERYRELSPSEKAFAYQLEFEQSEGQGVRSDLTSYHDDTKLACGSAPKTEDSKMTKWRYRQLTRLCEDGLLDAVDAGLFNLNTGVELASLSEEHQRTVYRFFFEPERCAYRDSARQLSTAIAKRLVELQEGGSSITESDIEVLFDTGGKREYTFPTVKLPMKKLRKLHPSLAQMTENEVQQLLMDALERYLNEED